MTPTPNDDSPRSSAWPPAPDVLPAVSDVYPGGYTKPQLIQIARGQKLVVISLLLALLTPVAINASHILGGLYYWAVCLFALIVTLYLANALRPKSMILYIIGMFIPIVSLLVLLRINGRATEALNAAGVKVGLLGAKLADVERLNDRIDVTPRP
ncbi:MAG TPA: hypothetical protein VGK19_10235 [Capsulimonadaceae bacterium]|jgi:F0F1-type ATP synthase assembly protein I